MDFYFSASTKEIAKFMNNETSNIKLRPVDMNEANVKLSLEEIKEKDYEIEYNKHSLTLKK